MSNNILVLSSSLGHAEAHAPFPDDVKLKRTTKAESKQEPAFHPFTRLPAEVRARIWAIALEDQITRVSETFWSRFDGRGSVVIHEHEEKDGHGRLIVISTHGYPALFSVNREARYEAAKLDGGTWYTLGVGAFEVYANLDKERVYFATCCLSPELLGTPLRSKAYGTTVCLYRLLSNSGRYTKESATSIRRKKT